MKRRFLLMLSLYALLLTSCNTEVLQALSQDFGIPLQSAPLDDPTIARGLKEALSVGTKRAVSTVSVSDGYFGNAMIKILLPAKMQEVADVLGKVGFQKQVDEFILSMNRAAEKAAPKAGDFFVDAVREMTFDDARKILYGGDTSATDYFRQKTSQKIHAAFKPIVATSMNDVGATRAYKKVMGNYAALPFASRGAVDIDTYVTGKAVDGLFTMLGEEEKRIRNDPAARVTELLRRVFSGK